MKSTQNEKILQIKPETLIVGVDIEKETHYARAIDARGIEQAKLLRFGLAMMHRASTALRHGCRK